jgi:hypothetical protein
MDPEVITVFPGIMMVTLLAVKAGAAVQLIE